MIEAPGQTELSPKDQLTTYVEELESLKGQAAVNIDPLVGAYQLHIKYPNLMIPVLVSGLGYSLDSRGQQITSWIAKKDIFEVLDVTTKLSPELEQEADNFVSGCAEELVNRIKNSEDLLVAQSNKIISGKFAELWKKEQPGARKKAAEWALRMMERSDNKNRPLQEVLGELEEAFNNYSPQE